MNMHSFAGARTHESWTRFLFVSTFALVVLLFVGTNLYVLHGIRSLDSSAGDIADNAAPSITHLSAMRAIVPRIVLAADAVVDAAAAGSVPDTTQLTEQRRQLDAEARMYLDLPAFPGERALWEAVTLDMARADELLARVSAQVERGDVAGAQRTRRELHALMDAQVSPHILRVISLNASQARARAAQIRATRAASTATLLELDAVSSLLALLLAVWTLRAIRGYELRLRAFGARSEERAHELEQFSARVAHDVKSPLTTAVLEVDALSRHAAGDERVRAGAARARRSLDRVVGVVDGLLTFARAGAHAEPDARADASAVVHDVVQEILPQAAAAKVDLLAEPSPPIEVRCDPALLAVVVTNLVQNAIKFLSGSPVRRVRVRLQDRGATALLEVADTGPGVPLAARETIFLPYVRGPDERRPGLGLGLATVQRICERHGGRVGVSPAPGGGSVFYCEFPKAEALPHRAAAKQSLAHT